MPASKSTQDFVAIKEIRNNVVILKDGTYRGVLIASSVNFSLKSEDEKTGLIMQYQNFLNSLDFSIQIHLESRRLDIQPYVSTLETITKEQTNELIKIQAREYIEFIKTFTEATNVMTKSFFVIVPYEPAVINNKESILAKIPLPGRKSVQTPTEIADNFEETKIQLEQRMDVVASGLGRVGIKTAPLGTEELIELYFKIFNPGEHRAPSIK